MSNEEMCRFLESVELLCQEARMKLVKKKCSLKEIVELLSDAEGDLQRVNLAVNKKLNR